MAPAIWNGRFQVDGLVLVPAGDHRPLDGQTGDGAQDRGEQQGLDPTAPAEHLGHHGHIGQGEGGRGLPGDENHQDQQPVAAHHGEHPGGDAHDDQASRHIGRTAAHPALGPVAQPPGHRIGDPTDQPVGGQGEGDGQRARGPLLDEQGDEYPRDGQVGPGADQPDRESEEAPDPGAVDAPQCAGGAADRRRLTSGRLASGRLASGRLARVTVAAPAHPGVSFSVSASAPAGSDPAPPLSVSTASPVAPVGPGSKVDSPLTPAAAATSAPTRWAPSICT